MVTFVALEVWSALATACEQNSFGRILDNSSLINFPMVAVAQKRVWSLRDCLNAIARTEHGFQEPGIDCPLALEVSSSQQFDISRWDDASR